MWAATAPPTPALDSSGVQRESPARSPPGRRRVLCVDRAAPASRAARQARRGGRQRPARRRHDRQLRGAPIRRRLGDTRLQSPTAVSTGGVPRARLPHLSGGLRADDGDRARSHVEQIEVVGLDEAYLDVDGLFSPRAAMRRLVAEISRELQLTCSVGIGPNKLVAKVASDAEKPAGFVVLTREQACARFASAPPGLVPGIGPKTAARLAELGLHTLAAVGGAPEQLLVERFGPNLGRELGRRARFQHDGRSVRARKVVSESRERTFDRDISRPRGDARDLTQDGRRAVREPRRARARGPHDRDQGAPRRLHHRHASAQRRPAHMRRAISSAPTRCGCCKSTRRSAPCGCSA